MKKVLLVPALGLLCFASCNKQKDGPQNVQPDQTATVPGKVKKMTQISTVLADQISVSNYGFLVFPNEDVYAEYITFLNGNNANDIMSFLGGVGVASQVNIQGQAGNFITPDEDNGAYVFNQNGIVQIGDIVYRGINSEGSFLAMPVGNLTPSTYQLLVSKQFDPATMAKLRVGGDYTDDPHGYIMGHIGYTDQAPPVQPPVVCGLVITHIYTGGGTTIIDTSYYFLGIRYKHTIVVIH